MGIKQKNTIWGLGCDLASQASSLGKALGVVGKKQIRHYLKAVRIIFCRVPEAIGRLKRHFCDKFSAKTIRLNLKIFKIIVFTLQA